MSKRLVPNPVTGQLDLVEDISQLESDVSTAVQPGDNVSDLVNDAGYQNASQVNTQVNNAVAGLVDSAPAALDTLNELANALGDDPNFATTVNNQIAGKADLVHTHTHDDITDFDAEVQALIASTRRNKNTRNVYEEGVPDLTLQATDEVINLRGEVITLPDPALHLGRELIFTDETTGGTNPTGTGVQLISSQNWIEVGGYYLLALVATEVSFGGSPAARWAPLTKSANLGSELIEMTGTDTTLTRTIDSNSGLVTVRDSSSNASTSRVFNLGFSSLNVFPGKKIEIRIEGSPLSNDMRVNINGESLRPQTDGSDNSFIYERVGNGWELQTELEVRRTSAQTSTNGDRASVTDLEIGDVIDIVVDAEMQSESGEARLDIREVNGGTEVLIKSMSIFTGDPDIATDRIRASLTANIKNYVIQNGGDIVFRTVSLNGNDFVTIESAKVIKKPKSKNVSVGGF